MKRLKFLNIFLLLFIVFSGYTQNLILDDVTIDKESVFITFHNYPDDITSNITLMVDNKEKNNFNITLLNVRNLYYILIDNSGSLLEGDITSIKDKIKFFISNLKSNDLITIYKVNDDKTNIYKLNIRTDKTYEILEQIKREGNYSRLYDAVLSSYKELLDLKQMDQYKGYNYYLIFFSDGEDIESKNRGTRLLNLEGIPFFFFCYGDSYNEKLREPFIHLASNTNGKFLQEPDNSNIKKLFFDNENRYLLEFEVDLNKVISSKEYIVIISRKDDKNNKIEIDLKKFFKDKENKIIHKEDNKENLRFNLFKINLNKDLLKILIIIAISILLLILIVILFLLLRKLIFNKNFSLKDKNSTIEKRTNNNYINTTNIPDNLNTTQNTSQSIIINENKDNNKNYTTQSNKYSEKTTIKQKEIEKILEKESNIIIEYKTLKDNSPKRRYNKFDIFHSGHASYIDNRDNSGEEISIDSVFKILNIEKDFIDVESKRLFLIDEDIVISHILLKVVKIEYNIKEENFKIRLFNLEGKNLNNYFKISKEIIGTKKRRIFGAKDAIIEMFLKKDKEIEDIINNVWLKGELKKDKEDIILITENSLFLDIKISIRYNEVVNEYNIRKISKVNNKFYNYLY